MNRGAIFMAVVFGILASCGVFFFIGTEDSDGLSALDSDGAEDLTASPRRLQRHLPVPDPSELPDAEGSADSDDSSDSPEAEEEHRKRGEIRVMTKGEFLKRLRKLGLHSSGDPFGEIRDQRPDLGALFVLVSNEDERPVRGARVALDPSKPQNLHWHVSGRFSPDVKKHVSGFNGIARFKDLEPQPKLVAVEHDEYLPQFLGEVPITAGEPTYVEAVLEVPSAVIAGTVADRRDTPVAGAFVSARHFTEGAIPFVAATVTRHDGSFSVGVREDTQNLVAASKLGYQDGHKEGVLAGTENLEIVLRDAKTVLVSGFVTKGASSEPVPHFRVDSDEVFHPEGVFMVERNVSPEPRDLLFTAEGYEPRTISVTLAEDKDVDIGQVALFGGRELNGIVLLEELEARTPVADAVVSIVTDTGNTHTANTTADGLFSFKDLATESVRLTVTASGVEPYNEQTGLLEDQPTFVEVVLQPGEFNATGRIVDADTDEPIEGALVSVVERPELSTTTDAQGEYELLGIALPQFSLKANKEGYREEISPSLAGSDEGAYWEGRLTPTGIRFRLRVNGQPAPAGLTTLLWKEITPTLAAAQAAQAAIGSHRFQAVTDDEGVAIFEVEDGNYFLQVPSHRLHPTRVAVNTEETHTVTLELPGRTHLQGRIINADASPVANTSLWLHSGNNDYSTMFLYHTDAQGNYSIPNLAARPYALSIIKSVTDQSAQHVRGFIGSGGQTQTFNVTLPTLTSTISGQVVDQNGIGKSGVKIGVEYVDAPHRSILAGWVSTDETGRYVVPHLEPGNHVVRTAWTEDVAVFSDVLTVAPGQNTTVNLVAPTTPGLHIRGHVIASDGGPLGPNFLFVNSQGQQNGNFFSTMDWAYVGSFDVKGLTPGAHAVTVTAMGAQKKQITVTAGSVGNVVPMTREP